MKNQWELFGKVCKVIWDAKSCGIFTLSKSCSHFSQRPEKFLPQKVNIFSVKLMGRKFKGYTQMNEGILDVLHV